MFIIQFYEVYYILFCIYLYFVPADEMKLAIIVYYVCTYMCMDMYYISYLMHHEYIVSKIKN